MNKTFKKMLGLGLCFASVGTLAACSTPKLVSNQGLTNLKTENSEVKSEKEKLELLVASKNTELLEKQNELSALAAELEELEKTSGEKDARINDLLEHMSTLETSISYLNSEIETLQNQIDSLSGAWTIEDNSGDVMYGYFLSLYDPVGNVHFIYSDENNNSINYQAGSVELGSSDYLVDGNVETYKSITYYPRAIFDNKTIITSYTREYKVIPFAKGTYGADISKSNNFMFDLSQLSFEALTLDSELFPNKEITQVRCTYISEILRHEGDSFMSFGLGIDFYNTTETTVSLTDYANLYDLEIGTYYINATIEVEIFDGVGHNTHTDIIKIPVNIVE